MRLYTSPVAILALVIFISSCSPQPTTAPFVAPSGNNQITTEVLPFTPPPLPTVLGETPVPNATLPTLCYNSLRFIEDVNYPDGSVVRPGEKIEKLWQVENNGTCNWDSRYKMMLVEGDQLGAPAELSLYPARSGSQAELRVIFIAPRESRYYKSTWQAYGPDGQAFGDPFYIDIFVQTP